MRHSLTLHPDSRCVGATHIQVDVARPRSGALVLSYLVTGNISDLRIPPLTAAERADGLWKHTCFEAFARPSAGPGYYEFNLAPSTQWAAFWFDSYRRGMRIAAEIDAPLIDVSSSTDCYTLQAILDLNQAADLPPDGQWHLGLSAVIEETDGRRSYWALAHPPGKADFHHSVCFAHESFPASLP